MKVVLTQYRQLPSDTDSNDLPVAGTKMTAGLKRTTDGDFTALVDECRFIRIATDTAIHVKLNGTGAADTDEMMPANSVEFFGAAEGSIVSILTA